MKSKKATASSESIMTIIHFMILVFIAAAIFGISSFSYNYNINFFDRDSMLMSRAIIECISEDGVFDLDLLRGEDLLEYCGFSDFDKDRFLISIETSDDTGPLFSFTSGNEGLFWIKDIYAQGLASEDIDSYEPGYYEGEFNVDFLTQGEVRSGKLKMEVVCQNDK